MTVDEAAKKVVFVKNKLNKMRLDKEPTKEIRTVECNWFGALENNQLSKMSDNGELKKVYESVLPAEINVIGIGDTQFVFLPGELFVEYSLEIKKRSTKKTFASGRRNVHGRHKNLKERDFLQRFRVKFQNQKWVVIGEQAWFSPHRSPLRLQYTCTLHENQNN